MIVSVKHMICLMILVGALGSAAVLGLKETTKVKSMSQAEVETIVHPFKIVMNLNKTEYKLGESVIIDLRLTNIGNFTVTLTFRNRSPPMWLRFRVYNASDDLVFTSSSLAWAAITEVSLDSGSFIGQTHGWDQTIGDPRYLDTIRQLEAGTYKIIGFLDSLYTSVPPITTLETPPIQISIS